MEFVVRNNEWIKLAEQAYEVQQQRKELEKQEKQLLDELKKYSEYKPSKGGNFVFEVSYRQGSINYRAIPELKQVNLELYRKEEVAQWKLNCFA